MGGSCRSIAPKSRSSPRAGADRVENSRSCAAVLDCVRNRLFLLGALEQRHLLLTRTRCERTTVRRMAIARAKRQRPATDRCIETE